jgi:DNA-binding NarL/FixJ family response regulator
VLKGLKEILSEGFDKLMLDETTTGYELINNVQNNQYDLVLLDSSLPDINGLEVLKEIKKKKPKLPVLIVSMYPEEQYALRAMKAGAQGYLTKRSASNELVLAVRNILSGKNIAAVNLPKRCCMTSSRMPKNSHMNDSPIESFKCFVWSAK